MGLLAHWLGYFDVFAVMSCQAYVWSADVIFTKLCLNFVISCSVDVFSVLNCRDVLLSVCMIWWFHLLPKIPKIDLILVYVFEIIPTSSWDIHNWTFPSVMASPWRILFEFFLDGFSSVCITWWAQFKLKLRVQDSIQFFLEILYSTTSLNKFRWIFLCV